MTAQLQIAHEGDQVVRWITGGSLPDAWVTFHHEGDQVIARCAVCRQVLGNWPENDVSEQTAQLLAIRQAGHESHKPANWPQVNIS